MSLFQFAVAAVAILGMGVADAGAETPTVPASSGTTTVGRVIHPVAQRHRPKRHRKHRRHHRRVVLSIIAADRQVG